MSCICISKGHLFTFCVTLNFPENNVKVRCVYGVFSHLHVNFTRKAVPINGTAGSLVIVTDEGPVSMALTNAPYI